MFEAGVVNVEIDDRIAENTSCESRSIEKVGGVFQAGWKAWKPRVNVGVSMVFIAAIEVFLNAGESSRQHRGKCKVGIGVCAGHPVLDAE